MQQNIIQPGKHAKTTFERLRLRLNRSQPYVEQITRQIASFVVSGHTLELDDDEMCGVFLATQLRLEQSASKIVRISIDDTP